MTPSINRMLRLLEENEKASITKEKVIKLESEVLKRFDFDFSMISPLPFLERFLRLNESHNDFFLDTLSLEILKLLSTVSKYLEFKSSLIGAATMVVCLNLAEINS